MAGRGDPCEAVCAVRFCVRRAGFVIAVWPEGSRTGGDLRQFPTQLAALLVIGALGLLACQGCLSQSKYPEVSAATSSVGFQDLAGPGREWLEGRLPPEVNAGQPVPGGSFTIRIGSEPTGLNILDDGCAIDATVHYLLGPMYETLFEIDREPPYKLLPLLAESYEESEDRTTQVVRLRRGVRFHNGQHFTSKDVKAVLDAVLDPNHRTTIHKSYFADLASYEAPTEYTVMLRWKKPNYLGFRGFATAVAMVPWRSLQGDFSSLALNKEPIGTGPFRFEHWEPNREISLVNHEQYWGKHAYLSKVILRIVKDQTLANQLFERGEFDLMTSIQPVVWRALEKPDAQNAWAVRNYNRIYVLANNFSWIGWNQQRPFFRDRRVRTALAMLFPYEQVRQNIDLGLEIPTTCPFYIESAYCDPDVIRLEYNPERARRLLSQAGWADTNGDGILDKDGLPFHFTLLISAHSVRMGKIAAVLQVEYKKLGIEMDVEKVEFPRLTERMLKHQFDAAFLLWINSDFEQDNYAVFHSSQSQASNFVSYSNPEVDRLLVETRQTFDDRRRIQVNRALHRLLYHDQVYNFVSVRPTLDAVKKRVRGIRPSPTWYDLRRVWIEPEGSAESR